MKKHVLFIQPTIYDRPGKLHAKPRRLHFVALTFPLLAALTPSDWEVDICLETIEEIPWETEASVIAISGMGHGMVRGREIAIEFKRRGKTVIFGGYMPSLVPEETLKFCDSVVIGDAEGVWGQVIDDLERNNLQRTYEQTLTQLTYPLPRYDLILKKRIGGFLPVQAGRGCPHTCSFCSIYCRYRGAYIRRDINEVVRDIAEIKRLGFRRFLLLDDNIASDHDHLFKLCEAIKPFRMQWMSQCVITVAENPDLLRVMAESGCVALGFGLESLSSETLRRFRKGWMNPDDYTRLLRRVEDAGIDPAVEMIIGTPEDTVESLRATVDFIIRARIFTPKFFILTPIPGTDFHKEAEQQGMILEPDPYLYDPAKAVLKLPNFSPEQLEAELWRIYDKVYSVPNILRRNLLGRRWWLQPRRYLFNLFVNFYYRSQIQQRIAPFIV